MSNAGQALSGVVGAVVGFFIGGPTGAAYGFQIGYLAGTALFPTQLPHLQGPRLGEGQQTVSTVGQPIPWIFGTQVVGGNIIWASPIREVATTQDVGGKGGPEQSQTTYTYYRSFAILLCEGPIGGVRRVWANGKILYDARPQLEDEDDNAFIERQALNEDFLSKVTIYLGTEDQMPDPTIESFKGVGNVPAYRGYAYVVFDDVELKPEDGNRIPAQWKFEVYEDGTGDSGSFELYSNEVLYPWGNLSNQDPRNLLNAHIYEPAGGGVTYDTLEELLAAEFPGGDPEVLGYSSDPDGVIHPYFHLGGGDPPPPEVLRLTLALNRPVIGKASPYTLGQSHCEYLAAPMPGDSSGGGLWAASISPEMIANADWDTRAHLGGNPGPARYTDTWLGTTGITNCGGGRWIYRWTNFSVWVERVPSAPPDPCDVGQPSGIPGYCIYNGVIVPSGPWERVEGTTFHVLQKYENNGSIVTKYPLNPARPAGHEEYNDQAFWETAYAEAVARGQMIAGLIYGVDYPQSQNFGYRLTRNWASVGTFPVSLASIVSRICERAGLANYDVSDLEAEYVIGYQVSRPMAARAAIEPLRSVGFFDVVENGVELKFTKRGKATVATLTHDDLGAHFAGEERPSAITTTKALELELPRQIRVHYQNPEMDFDPGEELSPTRYDTDAESVTDIDLAVAITPDKAAQIAEVLFRDAWASRWVHLTTVDVSKSELQPADCILVPVDGSLQRMRIANVTERLPNLRQLELMRDDDGAYVSHAVGTSSQRIPPRLEFYGPVECVFLDLPPLSTTHNDAGFYAAARPTLVGGGFRGAAIARSHDGGATYSDTASVTGLATIGTILADVPAGVTTIFDNGNEIRVELRSGAVESMDEESVLNGANAAAIGAPGRWEIVQFKDATHVTGNIYSLTSLLRGRRGTEHNVGKTIAGDTFVLLADVGRVPMALEDVDASLDYRVSPIGGRVSTDVQTFTGTGEALRPFSPVHIEGSRNEDGDLVITWVRRDRLASDLEIPMSEATEDYEVDVLDDTGEVRRTISVSDPAATYSAEMQTDDFGSPQTSITIRVYQISEDVGRGYPAEATL